MSRWRSLRRLISALLQEPEPAPVTHPVVPERMSRSEVAASAEVSAAREALRGGDAASAAEAAQTALALAPNELCAVFYLGQALIHQQRIEEARELFAQAAVGQNPFGLATIWLARVEQMLADDPWPGPQVSAAIELERSARAALRQGELAEAEALAREALAADPENLLARHHLGQALVAQGRRDEALAEFEAARGHGAGLGLIDAWIVNALTPDDEPPAAG